MKYNILLHGLMDYLKELIDNDDFLNEFRMPRRFVRKGLLSLRQMVLFLLFRSRQNLDNKSEEFRELFKDCEFPDVSKQALSKARYGIKWQLFADLFHETSEYYYKHVCKRKLWKTLYHLFAIDGTEQEIPASESTAEYFGSITDPDYPDYYNVKGKASVLQDVKENIIVDAVLEKHYADEREMARMHLARLVTLDLVENCLVIFDRGYFSEDLYEEFVRAGCKCLMRLKKDSHLCKAVEDRDEAIEYIMASDRETPLLCRVIKVTLPKGETEYLVTNAEECWITPNDFKELYFERWKIESKYFELKEQWAIEEYSGTGTLAVLQDFYVTMMQANLASIIQAQANVLVEENSKKSNAYKYKARMSYIIGKIRKQSIRWLITLPDQEQIDELIRCASRKKTQIQPNRTFERGVKYPSRRHRKNKKATF